MEAATGVVGGGGVRVVARICAHPAAATTTTAAASPAATLFRVDAERAGDHPRSPDAAALLHFGVAAAPPTSSSSQGPYSCGRCPSACREEERRLDWCYLPDETNCHIFLTEVKPLLHRLLQGTSGCSNACVVACGGAAAMDLIFPGSRNQPPLLVSMAMKEILEHSKPSVGWSVSRFTRWSRTPTSLICWSPRTKRFLCWRTHRGTLISGASPRFMSNQLRILGAWTATVRMSTIWATLALLSNFLALIRKAESAVAKMNFLSLTDPKQKSSGGAAARLSSNRSMHALMNVVQALNSSQSFVPYRHSKVTRILKDSLCTMSGAVVISCLEEICCQYTVSNLMLAARSSQVKQKGARPTMSARRSQPIMQFSKISESSLSASIKMKQKDAKPRVGVRSQLITRSTNGIKRSLSSSIKMEKDAKPTTSKSYLNVSQHQFIKDIKRMMSGHHGSLDR